MASPASTQGAAVGPRTLVVLQEEDIRDTHSKFFADLEARGYVLSFAMADDKDIQLRRFNQQQYDNLIIFAPAVTKFASLDTAAVLEFVDEGRGNLLIAADFDTSDAVRDISAECGVDIDEPGTAVIDHHSYDASDPTQVSGAAPAVSRPGRSPTPRPPARSLARRTTL